MRRVGFIEERRTLLAALIFAGSASCVGNIGGAGDDESDDASQPLCSDVVDVGETPLRRLTRSQYDHSVAELFDGASSHGASFAADERLGAFYSNAIAPVSGLAVDDYMSAAEQLAAAAVIDLGALLPCDPDEGEGLCATEFIRSFGWRAYRRPLSDEEVARARTLYDTGRQDGPFSDGIELVIAGMLQSPSFLYHVEVGTTAQDRETADGVLRATDQELASRLSFFLWDRGPDADLLSAADAGELSSAEGVEAQVRRMLDDGRASATIASFHRQWLRIEQLAGIEKDAALFPQFDDELSASMRLETERFADYVIRKDDARLATLLTAPYTFANRSLAGLYGVEGPTGDELEKVSLDPTERGGLLTHASFLAAHAHGSQTSPVFRGKLVRENLLCNPAPPPPANVNDNLPDVDPNVSLREQLAQHRTDPACASCHELMDPIGLGFEGYDALGRFRTVAGNVVVDATGELSATKDADGPFDGAIELSAILADSQQVQQCVATQWLRYALGRLEQQQDACAQHRIYSSFEDADLSIRALIVSIATSDAMRYLRLPQGAR